MKILIVDDDELSTRLIKYSLLYANIASVETSQAANGQEAVELCKTNPFDLIFLDINMPIMNGFEAYPIIKQHNPSAIIIAMSSSRELEMVNSIIKTGFDDYLIKPFFKSLVKQRVQNYARLIEQRNNLSTSDHVNLFDVPCDEKVVIFRVAEENALLAFVKYMDTEHMHGCKLNEKCTIKTAIGSILNISTILMKIGKRFAIYIEKNETSYYFTITGVRYLNEETIEEILGKESQACHLAKMRFKFSHNQASIEAPILSTVLSSEEEVEELKEIAKEEIETIKEEPKVVEKTPDTYDFLDKMDLVEVIEQINGLESMFAISTQDALNSKDINYIASIINKLAVCLNGYEQTYNISMSLKSLGADIRDNSVNFIENSHNMSQILMDFASALKKWQTALFATGAPSVDFMDGDIISQAALIANMIKTNKQNDDLSFDP